MRAFPGVLVNAVPNGNDTHVTTAVLRPVPFTTRGLPCWVGTSSPVGVSRVPPAGEAPHHCPDVEIGDGAHMSLPGVAPSRPVADPAVRADH